VHGVLLAAAVHPDNTPHGYNLTFAFPMLMFIIVAGALFLRMRSPHRVPGHVSMTSSRWASGGAAAVASQQPGEVRRVADLTEVEQEPAGSAPAGAAASETADGESTQTAEDSE